MLVGDRQESRKNWRYMWMRHWDLEEELKIHVDASLRPYSGSARDQVLPWFQSYMHSPTRPCHDNAWSRPPPSSTYAQCRRADQAVSAEIVHVADVCTWSTDRGLFALLKMLASVPFDLQQDIGQVILSAGVLAIASSCQAENWRGRCTCLLQWPKLCSTLIGWNNQMIESDSANVVTTVQIKHQTLSRLGPIYGEIRKAQNFLGHVRFVKVPRGQNRRRMT
jgi:hypothetical protein